MAETHAETDSPASPAAQGDESEPGLTGAGAPAAWPVAAEPEAAGPVPEAPAEAESPVSPAAQEAESELELADADASASWPMAAEPVATGTVAEAEGPVSPAAQEEESEPGLADANESVSWPVAAEPAATGTVAEADGPVSPAAQEEASEPRLADANESVSWPIAAGRAAAGTVVEAPAEAESPVSPTAQEAESELQLDSAYEPAAWPVPAEPPPTGAIHHIELWVADLDKAIASWGWLLTAMGYRMFQDWPGGRSWRSGHAYIVVEQSPARTASRHDRCRPGLNHMAFHVSSRDLVDELTREAMLHGWRLMFAEEHPFAGGPQHYASYLENMDGFEVELVAD